MKRLRTVRMTDVVRVNNHDYFVAEINTKGNKEILELDIIRPSEGQSLKIEIIHNTKTGESVTNPVLPNLTVFWDDKSKNWKFS